MTRINALNRRYAASLSLVNYGVEILAIGDPPGARLDAAARDLMIAAREDGPGLWDELVGAVRSLRWRCLTQPQPIAFNFALREGTQQVVRQVNLLRGSVANVGLLDCLEAAAVQISESDPAPGAVLMRCIQEVGPKDCVIVAASTRASLAMSEWLQALGVQVLTPAKLEKTTVLVEQSYAVGPPRFFPSSLVTAPVTNEVSFVMPSWFRDSRIPCSPIAPYADGALHIGSRIFTEGELTESPTTTDDVTHEHEFLPQAVWSNRQSPEREPSSEEVEARKVLLSGDFAIWLDDGERIRIVDPQQPVGERVTYMDVRSVRPGTYLLLRRGETERQAMHEAALERLGDRGPDIRFTQQAWKGKLHAKIDQIGHSAVMQELNNRGVKTAIRVRAWVAPTLIRPHSNHDFEQLLQWLNISIQPSFENATLLRKTIYKVSAEIRDELESAVSTVDLSSLERDGHVSLDLRRAGFRGLLATRVLAVSPHTEIVPRHEARVPFIDRSGQWLE